MPGIGPNHLEPWDLTLSEGTERHKARFALATAPERRAVRVFDPFTHGNVGCRVAQGVGNATRRVQLRIRQHLGMDLRREPSGMDGMHTQTCERRVTVPLDLLRLLHGTRTA